MNEQEPVDPGIESESKEPTVQDLIAACQEVIPQEKCQDLLDMDFPEALGYAVTMLFENGIEDPEAFLMEKCVLEK